MVNSTRPGERMEFAVIGDVVNVASCFPVLAKREGTDAAQEMLKSREKGAGNA